MRGKIMLSNFPYKEGGKKMYTKSVSICSTCNNAGYCIQNKKNLGPVFYCEEFDDYIPVKPKSAKVYQRKKETFESSYGMEIKKLLGLCSNCDYVQSCTHIIPEGGIWHCEDYQ